MNKLITGAALAIVSTHPLITLANDKMEEVIITSSRIEMPLRQVATSVSIITETDIKNLGLTGLADVLSTQPSIGISSNGGTGATTSIKIRGEESFRTLVLIDGMDVSDTASTQIGPRVENMLSAGVGRVEVLRGPQGMMYGADAGGIVNISSYIPRDSLGGELSAEGGRYDTRQFNANLGGKNETGDFSLSATDLQTNGFNARDDDLVLQDDDGYENTTLHARGGWNATDRLRLQLIVRDVDAENNYDNCDYYDEIFNQIPSDNCQNTFAQSGGRLALDYKGDKLTHQLAANYTETDREFFSDGIVQFAPKGELEKYEYLGSFKANENNVLVYGADLKKESMEDNGQTFDRDQTGVYLEYQGSFSDQIFLTAGGRYDDNDDFGKFASYRLSAAYLIETAAGTIKLKSSYGTGFRAPSLYEITYNNGPYAYPPASDAELKEEKSRGLDIGVEYFANSGLHLEAVYFDQTIEDEIYFDLVVYSGYLQGSGDTDSRGVELIGEAPIAGSWHLSGNYTYNDTENSSGSTRIHRPKHLANLGLLYLHDSGRFKANLYVRGSYDAIDIDGSELDDYEVVNINTSFNITQALELYGRVENLLDEDYQQVPSYNTSGAAGYAGVRYSF